MLMRTRGFTLVDLLVVIVCVAILVTLSACMWSGLDGHPITCTQNLKGIGTAIAMFKGEDKYAKFPLLHTSGSPESNIRAADAGKNIDELRENSVGREAAMQNMWMIIDKGLVTEEAFQCPWDRDFKPREFKTAAQRQATKIGWQSSANFSYGLHLPYKSNIIDGKEIENPAHLQNQLPGSFVIMSDKNPSRTNEPATGVGPGKATSHHADNLPYLMFSGAVNRITDAKNSQVNGDDIYTINKQDNANGATPADLDDQYITRHPFDD